MCRVFILSMRELLIRASGCRRLWPLYVPAANRLFLELRRGPEFAAVSVHRVDPVLTRGPHGRCSKQCRHHAGGGAREQRRRAPAVY
jgi:hypothetical protein